MSEHLANLGTQWGLIAVCGLIFCIWWLAVNDDEDN